MMRRIVASLVLSFAYLFGVPAKADIVALSGGILTQPSAPVGTTAYVENFDSAPASGNFSNSFATFASGGASVVNGSVTNQWAAPFFGPGADTTNYLAVLGGTTETVTLKAGLLGATLGIYLGSLDTYNSILFYNGANLIKTISGTDIASATGLIPNVPNQTSYDSNRFLEFSNLGSFTSVVFSSATNSLELDNLTIDATGTLEGGVPETCTWVMMILGFLSVGFVSYRRKGAGLAFRWV